MFRKMLLGYKWKKLRIRIWEKRLLNQLSIMSHRFSPSIKCSLHISWGPFYSGSVIMNRACTKAKISVQIPYDRYITSDEQQVMSRYQITKNALPYFIFFHECFHLIDALSHLQRNKEKDIITYQAALKRAAQTAKNYRKLSVEERADDFAYLRYLELCEKAG